MTQFKYILLGLCTFALSNLEAQTTINLADQCNCEVFKSTTEVSAGATAPAGADTGDLLVDSSGDIFFWDGDSWEPSAGDGDAWGVSGEDQASNISRTGNVTISNTNREALTLQTTDNAASNGIAFQNVGGSYTWNIFRETAGGNDANLVFSGGQIETNPADLTERFRINSGGNVGIGINTPAARLDVNGTGRFRNIPAGAASDGVVTTDANGNLRQRTAAEVVAAAGVVGTDDQNLTLTGTNLAIEDGNTVDLSSLQDGTGTDDQNLTLTGTNLAIEDGNTVDLSGLQDGDAWGVSGEDQASTISRTGDVVINNSNKAALTLKVQNNADSVGLAFQHSGSFYNWNIWRTGGTNPDLVFSGGVSGTLGSLPERMRMTQNGRLGIGTDAPTTRLDVNGNGRIRNIPNGAAADGIVTTDADGNLRQRTAAQIVAAGGGVTATDGDAWGVSGEDQAANIARTGNIRIGDNTPATNSKLDIVGTDRLSHFHFGANEDIYLRGGTTMGNVLLNDNGGNVGIGTNSPEALLRVTGVGAANPNATGTDPGEGLRARIGNGNAVIDLGISASFTPYLQTTSAFNLANNENFSINPNGGRVGIGLLNPAAVLDVDGNARVRSIPAGAAADGIVTTDANGNLRQRTAAEIVAAGGGGADGDAWGVDGEDQAAEISRTGNVIINNDSRTALTLKVPNNADSVGLAFQNSGEFYNWNMFKTSGTTPDLVFSGGVSGTLESLPERMRIRQNGNVGIGVTVPTEKLQVGGNIYIDGNGAAEANPLLRIHSASNTDGEGGRIEFNEANTDFGYTLRHNTDAGAYGEDGLFFETKDAGTYTPIMGYTNAGNVGIGTTTPNNKLDVNGNIEIDSEGATAGRRLRFVRRAADGTSDGVSSIGTIVGTVSGLVLSGNNNAGGNGNNHLFVQTDNGRVGLSTVEPTAKLDVNGFVRFRGIPAGDASNVVVTADADGNIRSRTAAQIVAEGGGITTTDGDAWGVDGEDQAAAIARTGSVTLGQNTSAGNSKLDIVGTDRQSHFHFGADEDIYLRGGTNAGDVLLNDNGGNVGIGTATPGRKLDVAGDIGASESIVAGRTSGSVALTINDGQGNANIAFNHENGVPDQDGNSGRINVNVDSNTDAKMKFSLAEGVTDGTSVTTTDIMTLRGNGNVGIGTDEPGVKLQIAPDTTFAAGVTAPETLMSLKSPSIPGVKFATTADFRLGDLNPSGTNTRAQLDIALSNGASNQANNTVMTLLGNGRVGLGTTTPTSRLDVNGNARVRTLPAGVAADGIVTTDADGNLRQRTAAEIVAAGGGADGDAWGVSGEDQAANISRTGNVTINNDNKAALTIQTTDNTLANGLAFQNSGASYTWNMFREDAGSNNADLVFAGGNIENNLDDLTERMRIQSNGNVGINNPNPSTGLDVRGVLTLREGVYNNSSSNPNPDLFTPQADQIVFQSDLPNNNIARIAIRSRHTNVGNNNKALDFVMPDSDATITTNQPNVYLMTLTSQDKGRVGINTTDPTAKLDVNGNARVRTLPAGVAADGIVTTDVNGNLRQRTAAQIVAAGGGVTSTDGDAWAVDGEDQAADIARTGSVTLGQNTASAASKLDIVGTDRQSHFHFGADEDIYLRGGTNAGDVLLNDNGGNVGIGTNAPSSTLTVTSPGVTDETGGIRLENGSSNSEIFQNADADLVIQKASNPNQLVLNSDGRVGINTDAPTAKLDVDGFARVRGIPSGTATDFVLTADADGNIRRRTVEQVVDDGSGVQVQTLATAIVTNNLIIPLTTTLGNPGSTPGETVDQATIINFNTETVDPGNNFDISGDTYTAPETGSYLVTLTASPNPSPGVNQTGFYYPLNLQVFNETTSTVLADNRSIRYATPGADFLGSATSVQAIVSLTAGQAISARVALVQVTNAAGGATEGLSAPDSISFAPQTQNRVIFSVVKL